MVLCCPGGVARHLWLFKCTWKKSEYLVSPSHYSHWSVSPWKVLNGYVRQEAAMLDSMIWDVSPQQEASHFHCTVLENVLSPALLYNPSDTAPTVFHLTSLLQPCGFFAETLLQAARWSSLLQFHFSPCMHHHWTHSQSSCLICIAVNLFNLLCPCENVKSMRKRTSMSFTKCCISPIPNQVIRWTNL